MKMFRQQEAQPNRLPSAEELKGKNIVVYRTGVVPLPPASENASTQPSDPFFQECKRWNEGAKTSSARMSFVTLNAKSKVRLYTPGDEYIVPLEKEQQSKEDLRDSEGNYGNPIGPLSVEKEPNQADHLSTKKEGPPSTPQAVEGEARTGPAKTDLNSNTSSPVNDSFSESSDDSRNVASYIVYPEVSHKKESQRNFLLISSITCQGLCQGLSHLAHAERGG